MNSWQCCGQPEIPPANAPGNRSDDKFIRQLLLKRNHRVGSVDRKACTKNERTALFLTSLKTENGKGKGVSKLIENAEKNLKTIIDREKLMARPEGCPACGNKFNMGEPAVYACGAWGDKLQLIHESDAVFDPERQMYVERKCYEAGRGPV